MPKKKVSKKKTKKKVAKKVAAKPAVQYNERNSVARSLKESRERKG